MSLSFEREEIQQAVYDLRIAKSIAVACMATLIWDNLLTLREEVDFIWKSKPSFGKTFFFMTRYPLLIESVVWCIFLLDQNASQKFCRVAFYLNVWTTILFVVPVQIVIMQRTVVLWNRNLQMTAFIIIVFAAADIVMVTSAVLVSRSVVFQDLNMLRPILGCTSDIIGISIQKTIPAWAANMFFDTIIFVLTVTKALNGSFKKGRLLRVLVRDGALYYFFILAASAANLLQFIITGSSPSGLTGCLMPVLRACMSIIGSRIILNLRGVAIGANRSSSAATQSLHGVFESMAVAT